MDIHGVGRSIPEGFPRTSGIEGEGSHPHRSVSQSKMSRNGEKMRDRGGETVPVEKLQGLVEQINRSPLISNRLMFEFDSKDGLTIVKIVDVRSKEVIRQIPSEEALARLRHISAYLQRLESGGEAQASQRVDTGVLLSLVT